MRVGEQEWGPPRPWVKAPVKHHLGETLHMDLDKEVQSQSSSTAGKELPGGLHVEGKARPDGGAARTFWELWWARWALLTQEGQLSHST